MAKEFSSREKEMSFETKAEPETGPVSETTVDRVQGEHVPGRTGGDMAGLGGMTLPTKVRPVKAMVFPVVRYGCESRTVRKAERRRMDKCPAATPLPQGLKVFVR